MYNKILKLIVSDCDVICFNRPPFEEPLFTFVSIPKGGTIKCKTELVYCREILCEYIRQDFRGIENRNIVKSKLHMVIYRRVPPKLGPATFKNQVLAGQNLVNTIEIHYGWPLTKVYKVSTEYKDTSNKNNFYYINASKRWIKSPIMLSLFTLLFRIAMIEKTNKFSHKVISFDTLFEVLGTLAKKSNQIELSYFKAHGHLWELVLDHYRELFGKRSMSNMYSPDSDGYFFTEGINKLCDGNSGDKDLACDFAKVMAKPGQKKRIEKRMKQSDPST